MAALRTPMVDPAQTETVGINDASVDPTARLRATYMKLFERTREQFRSAAIVTSA